MPAHAGIPVESLVIVCCHAIWLGGSSRGQDESEWLIEPFQAGETPTFISHIKLGLNELASDEGRILVFSGGDTKRDKTMISEAASYRSLALANNLFGHPASLASRICIDEDATDSFQNVLFPFVKFAVYAASYPKSEPREDETMKDCRTFPKHVTIVGHDFKRRRFENLHLAAVRWPLGLGRFRYIGNDPPMDTDKRIEVLDGEMLRGYGAWEKDLYGTGEILANKRKARGWTAEKEKRLQYMVSRGWHGSECKDEILALLTWDGGETGQELYLGTLPWDGSGS